MKKAWFLGLSFWGVLAWGEFDLKAGPKRDFFSGDTKEASERLAATSQSSLETESSPQKTDSLCVEKDLQELSLQETKHASGLNRFNTLKGHLRERILKQALLKEPQLIDEIIRVMPLVPVLRRVLSSKEFLRNYLIKSTDLSLDLDRKPDFPSEAVLGGTIVWPLTLMKVLQTKAPKTPAIQAFMKLLSKDGLAIDIKGDIPGNIIDDCCPRFKDTDSLMPLLIKCWSEHPSFVYFTNSLISHKGEKGDRYYTVKHLTGPNVHHLYALLGYFFGVTCIEKFSHLFDADTLFAGALFQDNPLKELWDLWVKLTTPTSVDEMLSSDTFEPGDQFGATLTIQELCQPEMDALNDLFREDAEVERDTHQTQGEKKIPGQLTKKLWEELSKVDYCLAYFNPFISVEAFNHYHYGVSSAIPVSRYHGQSEIGPCDDEFVFPPFPDSTEVEEIERTHKIEAMRTFTHKHLARYPDIQRVMIAILNNMESIDRTQLALRSWKLSDQSRQNITAQIKTLPREDRSVSGVLLLSDNLLRAQIAPVMRLLFELCDIPLVA